MASTRQEPASRYAQLLSVEKEEHGSTVVFRCRGPFSGANGRRLREFEREVGLVGATRVVFDFREVTYLDSRGLGTLAACVKKTGEQGKELFLVPTPHIRDAVITTNLNKLMHLCETPEAALS